MYSRNCGSNWPSSPALMARSTRGSALIGPGPISRRGAGFSSSKSSAMRLHFQPVMGDVDPPRDPDFVFTTYITQEFFQRGKPPRPADQAAVQPDRQHARGAPAFLVE